MLRTSLIALGLALLTTAILAKPGIVKTRDGRTLQGDITETDTGVIIKTRGIRFGIGSANVESIQYQENVESQLRERFQTLEPQDFEGRMQLAREAFDASLYELAREAVDQALQIDPNSLPAVTLMNTIQNHLRLLRAQERAATQPATRTVNGAVVPVQPRLTPEQINLIRQAELRRGDVNVPIRFENEVERRYASQTRQDIRALKRKSTIERALEILATRDPTLTEDVRVMRDPLALADFRQRVQPTIIAGCASSGCHGGSGAGGLALIAPAGDEASAYTNFYLLQSFRRGDVLEPDDGRIFDRGAAQRLISRTRPEGSLLLEYGLPQGLAQVPHPRVAGFRPAFRSRTDPRYQQVLAWIASLPPPEPDYGIELIKNAAAQPADEGVDEVFADQATPQPPATQPHDPPATQPALPAQDPLSDPAALPDDSK